MTTLITHLQTHLGPIARSWSVTPDGAPVPFQLVEFDEQPVPGARVVCTLGLSETPLRFTGDSHLRQELMLMYRVADGYTTLRSTLQQIALEALAAHRAFQIGDVIGPRGTLVGTQMEAFYVTTPILLSEEFAIHRTPDGSSIVFGWLVPISRSEASYINDQGCLAFADLMDEHGPDELDFKREPVV